MTTGFGVTPDEASLAGVFRNFLINSGRDPASVFGRITSSLANPLASAYSVSGLLNPNPSGNFQNFLGGGIGQASMGALNNLRTLGGGQGNIPQATRDLFAGAAPGNTEGTDLENNARLALRNRYSPFIAGRFGNALIGNAQDQFESQLASAAGAGTGNPNYANALLQALGLGF